MLNIELVELTSMWIHWNTRSVKINESKFKKVLFSYMDVAVDTVMNVNNTTSKL